MPIPPKNQKDDSPECTSAPWGAWGRSATLGFVSLISKFVLTGLNKMAITNIESFVDQATLRPEHVGLITVSNHTSTVDDPAVLCALTPTSFFFTEHMHNRNRWALCAKELCYKNLLLGKFFQSGKTLPIERGAGADQPVMQVVAQEVAHGGWLHIFPEGRVNYNGKLGALRWGLGKIVCDAIDPHDGRAPVVLPLYHSGMGDVMPKYARLPRIGKQVTVIVGEPVELSDVTCNCNRDGIDQRQVWKEITERVGHALKVLEEQAPPNTNQTINQHLTEQQRKSDDVLSDGLGQSEPR